MTTQFRLEFIFIPAEPNCIFPGNGILDPFPGSISCVCHRDFRKRKKEEGPKRKARKPKGDWGRKKTSVNFLQSVVPVCISTASLILKTFQKYFVSEKKRSPLFDKGNRAHYFGIR